MRIRVRKVQNSKSVLYQGIALNVTAIGSIR